MEPPKAPIVNVWSVRKEQLAARATSSNQQPATSEPPLPVSSAKSSSSRTASSRTTGKTATVADIPPVTDKESWPEVAASLSLDLNGKEKENERGLKEQPPKVEKTKKWVPIPVEELQATADALRASSSNRKSGSSKGDGSNRRNAQRGPPSQSASTSHSRVQSRSGSVQSSPRNAGRNRRLPGTDHDSNTNPGTHSPRVNGGRNLIETNSLKPHPASARSSKPGSPRPNGDMQYQQPPPGLHRHPLATGPHHPPPPSHLYPQQPFQPYGGLFPQQCPPPINFSPAGRNAALPPSPGRPNEFNPSERQYLYSTTAPTVNGTSSGPVQFGTIDSTSVKSVEEVTSAPVVNGGSRQLLIGVSENDLVRGVKAIGITPSASSASTKGGKKTRQSSFAVATEEQGDGKGKWEFGTTSKDATGQPEGGNFLDVVVEDPAGAKLSPLSMSLSASPGELQTPAGLGNTSGIIDDAAAQPPPGLGLLGQPQHPPGLSLPRDSLALSVNGPGIAAGIPDQPPVSLELPQHAAPDDFEVRDYGYGFGRVSGTGRAVEYTREEAMARQHERDMEKDREAQGPSQIHGPQHMQGQPPLSNSVNGVPGGHPENRRGPRMPRGHEGTDMYRGEGRGGANMRRGGRGGQGGGGGGGSHRQNRRTHAPHNAPIQNQPPFGHHAHGGLPGPLHMPAYIPPPFMHGPPPPHGGPPLEGMPSPTTYFGGMRPGYMGPHNLGAVSYLPPPPPPPPLPPQLMPLPLSGPPSAISPSTSVGTGPPPPGTSGSNASSVAPPVPAPLTALPFPLDPTRYYLLGQLEYYLSPQNMAKDFFLRQKMDSRGWIPVSVLASFNRVRKLTVDMNLVREMLYLSSMVQIRDDWVRMGGWERFVLPSAEESVVPEFEEQHPALFEAPIANMAGPPPLFGNDAPGEVPVPPMFWTPNGAPMGAGDGILPPGFAPNMPVANDALSNGEQVDDDDDVEIVVGN